MWFEVLFAASWVICVWLIHADVITPIPWKGQAGEIRPKHRKIVSLVVYSACIVVVYYVFRGLELRTVDDYLLSYILVGLSVVFFVGLSWAALVMLFVCVYWNEHDTKLRLAKYEESVREAEAAAERLEDPAYFDRERARLQRQIERLRRETVLKREETREIRRAQASILFQVLPRDVVGHTFGFL